MDREVDIYSGTKPTNIDIAKYYGLARQTIASYKKVKPKIYQALKEYFIVYSD